jgi:alkanesulfonate monooxygenase SsuD/methylene tetrahydromethanopterin reductase-like flavin-dependent oxidoreductase (luciferase family)
VVLDTRNPPHRVQEVARMCDGAGIDALWVGDHPESRDGVQRLDAWTTLTLVASGVTQARVGAQLSIAGHPPDTLGSKAAALDAAIGGRLELGLSPVHVEAGAGANAADAVDARADRFRAYAGTVRSILAAGPVLSIEAVAPWQHDVAAAVADDVLLPAAAVDDVAAAVDAARRACERAGRDADTLGIALEVPLSIGRTRAEAEARADAEPLFGAIGHPSEVGVFGTLEQCQERVIELAHAGVRDLRCILPNSDDVHDVIAQLTAVAIGSVDVLTPNAPRSKDPDPPLGWGGRARRR